jgi:hypothetical protein
VRHLIFLLYSNTSVFLTLIALVCVSCRFIIESIADERYKNLKKASASRMFCLYNFSSLLLFCITQNSILKLNHFILHISDFNFFISFSAMETEKHKNKVNLICFLLCSTKSLLFKQKRFCF